MPVGAEPSLSALVLFLFPYISVFESEKEKEKPFGRRRKWQRWQEENIFPLYMVKDNKTQ